MAANRARIERRVWDSGSGRFAPTGEAVEGDVSALEQLTNRLLGSAGLFLKGPVPWPWIIAAATVADFPTAVLTRPDKGSSPPDTAIEGTPGVADRAVCVIRERGRPGASRGVYWPNLGQKGFRAAALSHSDLIILASPRETSRSIGINALGCLRGLKAAKLGQTDQSVARELSQDRGLFSRPLFMFGASWRRGFRAYAWRRVRGRAPNGPGADRRR